MEGFGFSVRRSLLSRSSQFKPACSSCLLSLIQRNSSPSPAQSPPSHSSNSRVSPAFVFVILAVFVIFFTSCMLHIFVRFFAKLGSRSTASSGPFSGEFPGSDTFQRRLQQLFHLHDSGLDQATIDTLPVFFYEEIIGAKEPFDCAVCLSQFAEEDKLRLLPACSHAFHINCIDTWLLSNSTCPLCREPLVFFPEQSIDSRASDLEDDLTDVEISKGGAQLQWPKPVEMEERIFPVRLGKFRSCDNGDDRPSCDASTSNTSSSICRSLDSRRCFSLGSYRYEVSEDCRLRVALSGGENGDGGEEDAATGKKLGARSRGESFSVSKIWQWSGRKTEMAFTSQISQTQRAETGAQTNPSIFLT